MNDPLIVPQSVPQLLRRGLPLLKSQWVLYAAALSLAPITAATVIVQPYLLKKAIDDHIVPGDVEGLSTIAWMYLGAIVAAFVLEIGHTLAMSYGALATITELRADIYRHTLSRAQAFFDGVPTGRLLTRVTSDVESLGETLTAGAITILLDMLQVVGILVAMFWLDARLTLTLLFVGPPLALAIELIRRRLKVLFIEIRTSLASLNAYVSERLRGVETVQLYADEARTMALFDARLDAYRRATVATSAWDALLYATVDGLTSVTMALMLWYGSGGILEGVATAGLLAAFIDYVAKLFRPIQEFSQKVATLQRASAALGKIFAMLDVDVAITPGSIELDAPDGRITLRGLGFAYGDGPQILHDVDLDIAPGEVVALVGRTGSGKTTLGKLLTRAYDGYTGSITVDGHELRDITARSIRRSIGVVRQDVQLFPGDVRFNLTLGADLPDDALMEAVRITRAEAVVERLGGLEGKVKHDGRNLSSGEAQLLSFARTMACDPAVVILDEATASVDSITEARLQEATAAVLERKTTIVIAHRLSTIVGADRIGLLDAGRIVELGSHQELIEAEGAYAELFNQQFGDAELAS